MPSVASGLLEQMCNHPSKVQWLRIAVHGPLAQLVQAVLLDDGVDRPPRLLTSDDRRGNGRGITKRRVRTSREAVGYPVPLRPGNVVREPQERGIAGDEAERRFLVCRTPRRPS